MADTKRGQTGVNLGSTWGLVSTWGQTRVDLCQAAPPYHDAIARGTVDDHPRGLQLGAQRVHVIRGIRRVPESYTRPLLSSTYAVSVSVPLCVQLITSYDPSIY
jgi:hypothetical protein